MRLRTGLTGCVLCTIVAGCLLAAGQNEEVARQKERELIRILRSDAPPQDKAVPCKQLAIYGTADAVPALAALLDDEELASWARIALEAIPGPTADEALRDAAGRLEGRLLIGVINSIGVRRDPQAVELLAGKLGDDDASVVAAAADALGRIGGDKAAEALERALAQAPTDLRPAVAHGCVLCAERFLTDERYEKATSLYDRVRRAEVPKQRLLEAIRGAILARRSAGIPLLIEQLRSEDRDCFGIGLRTARELPGQEVTEALAAELDRANAARQPLLLLAIADRNDTAVLPVVVKAARSGIQPVRIQAVRVLERLGNASCIPVLLKAAGDADSKLAEQAKHTLAWLRGGDVDADLHARLREASGSKRQVLLEIAARRQMDETLDEVVESLSDSDPAVRGTAIEAIGVLGKAEQAGDLVLLLQNSQSSAERAATEKALLAISGRWGADCMAHLTPLTRSEDEDLRMIGLHVLAIVGGEEALALVQAALDDEEGRVQDEAARTLSTWPNNWPQDARAGQALMELARSGSKVSHRVLGLRGYLEYVRSNGNLSGDEKVARVREALSLVQRPEEKRLAVSVLGRVPVAGALDLLATLADDASVAQEACAAIVGLATGRNARRIPKERRRDALETVVECSSGEGIRKKAQEALKGLQ